MAMLAMLAMPIMVHFWLLQSGFCGECSLVAQNNYGFALNRSFRLDSFHRYLLNGQTQNPPTF